MILSRTDSPLPTSVEISGNSVIYFSGLIPITSFRVFSVFGFNNDMFC